MELLTEHAFIKRYPIDQSATTLILGTLHPAGIEDFELPFFYGNRNSLWKLFSKAYPEELSDPADLSQVLGFLKSNSIAVSDVIKKGIRTKTRSGDADLKVLEYHTELRREILQSQIRTVVCTGGNHPKGAFGIFTRKILGFKCSFSNKHLTQGVRMSLGDRLLTVHAIPSPSGAANRGIAASEKFKSIRKQRSSDYTVESYKIEVLQSVFTPILMAKTRKS